MQMTDTFMENEDEMEIDQNFSDEIPNAIEYSGINKKLPRPTFLRKPNKFKRRAISKVEEIGLITGNAEFELYPSRESTPKSTLKVVRHKKNPDKLARRLF